MEFLGGCLFLSQIIHKILFFQIVEERKKSFFERGLFTLSEIDISFFRLYRKGTRRVYYVYYAGLLEFDAVSAV